MSRTYKDRFYYKGWYRYEIKVGYYQGIKYKVKLNKWYKKPASWCTNAFITKKERLSNRSKIRIILKSSRYDLEDPPLFHKNNKPNADWIWI